jgi:hypothetical protein
MTSNLKIKTSRTLATIVFASTASIVFSSCSSPKPTAPPVVTRVSPGAPSEAPSFGASTIVDTETATATVVSINSLKHEIVLKRANGKLANCKARIGIVEFPGIKVGDIVTIAVGEERALAMGTTLPPDNSASGVNPLRVKVPTGLIALADAVETVAFTATIAAIDQFDRIVTLKLPNGETRLVQTTAAVNLADFNPGDVVSARISEVVVLTIQAPTK